MLIRSNPCYSPRFSWSRRRGFLLITRRLILATGAAAHGWAA